MIPINNPKVENIANEWANEFIKYINGTHRNNSQDQDKKTKSENKQSRLEYFEELFNKECKRNKVNSCDKKLGLKFIRNFLTEHKLLIGKPTDISQYVKDWEKDVIDNNKVIKVILYSIFKSLYKNFCDHIEKDTTDKYAYYIFKKLNVRTCPYCNRHYTFTIHKGSKKGDKCFSCRPEFDHFLIKEKYPFLAVSFYNLVPSCHECNHGKSTKESGINPYFKRFNSKFILKTKEDSSIAPPIPPHKMNRNEIMHISDVEKFEVDFENASESEKTNIKTFGLKELYNEHKDYVMEIIEKASAYDRQTQYEIINSFQGVFHSAEEIRGVIFGDYLSLANQSRKPLSKFTRDILDQLDIDC